MYEAWVHPGVGSLYSSCLLLHCIAFVGGRSTQAQILSSFFSSSLSSASDSDFGVDCYADADADADAVSAEEDLT
jgi:hypothetical protein